MSYSTPKQYAPCGCAVWAADGALHVQPCRDACPSVPTLVEAAAKVLGPVPVTDLRPKGGGCGEERPS